MPTIFSFLVYLVKKVNIIKKKALLCRAAPKNNLTFI
nr:MAG TPA: hypothetical protein [Caudoviricetes sp.]